MSTNNQLLHGVYLLQCMALSVFQSVDASIGPEFKLNVGVHLSEKSQNLMVDIMDKLGDLYQSVGNENNDICDPVMGFLDLIPDLQNWDET